MFVRGTAEHPQFSTEVRPFKGNRGLAAGRWFASTAAGSIVVAPAERCRTLAEQRDRGLTMPIFDPLPGETRLLLFSDFSTKTI
jgi:hypothetical protein